MVVAKRDPRVHIAQDYAAARRKTRRPQHRFNIRVVPYELQPFLLAPVLPGESVNDIMLQAQAWSDPLDARMKNIGWWQQYNFFYVRHRDLPEAIRISLAQMLLEPDTYDPTPLQSAQRAVTYNFAGGIDWMQLCLEHVTSEYFRDEGEDWNHAVGPNGLPLVQIFGRGSSDGVEHLTLESAYEDARLDLIDAQGHLYANDLTTMMGHYNAMRDAGLTDMDYQDFMKTYGSSVREDEASPNLHKAEDLWMFRDFTYPTNTIEPTTGIPAVAAGWRTAKNGGKKIFCDEPGFIFGTVNFKPKIYMSNQAGQLAGMMQSVMQWLPAVLHGQQALGHVFHDETKGPLAGKFGEEGYWLDVRDLLLYGDQFVNYAMADEVPFTALPKVDGQRRYVATNEVRTMFAESFKSSGVFQMDGLASLSILGRQEKQTSSLQLAQR